MKVSPLRKNHACLRDELENVLTAVDRLRNDAQAALSAGHPCAREIEDFWWRTRRFTEAISQRLGPV